jgi:acetolactate synthase-1/2/3 large subunit
VWEFTDANDYLGHSGGAGVGYGPGAMVGAALGARETGRLAVGIGGDGDFLMHPGALWTAAHYRIPMLYVINDNRSFFNDEDHQVAVARDRDWPEANAHIGMRMQDPEVDIAALARGYGAWAAGPVEDPEELGAAFAAARDAALAGATAVVHVRTAPR